MKRRTTTSSATEVEFSVVTRLPEGRIGAEEQTETSPFLEHGASPEGREIQPLTLALTMLALALLVLIPSLLLMQRLQP
jgi:hypothetical protein